MLGRAKEKTVLAMLILAAFTVTGCGKKVQTALAAEESDTPAVTESVGEQVLQGAAEDLADGSVDGSADGAAGDPAGSEDMAAQPTEEPVIPEEKRFVLTQEDIDQALEEVMKNYSATGVSVATIEHGELSAAGAWGWAVYKSREMTPDTKIRVASLSKVVVGMCAMAMKEDGILDLDAPLSVYWGEGVKNPYYTTSQPTARNLMTHTSSLKDLDTSSGLAHLQSTLSGSSAWRKVRPGDVGGYCYNNFGFRVLGTTLELASGMILDTYLNERFFAMIDADASFYPATIQSDDIAALYQPGHSMTRSVETTRGYKLPTEIGRGANYYNGGLTISAVDLAKMMGILASDGRYGDLQILSPELVEEMETAAFTAWQGDDMPTYEQCLVLRRQYDIMGQTSLYYHTGSAYGVYTVMSYNPDTGNGVIVITTGASWKKNHYGLYSLCGDLSEKLYAIMDSRDGQ